MTRIMKGLLAASALVVIAGFIARPAEADGIVFTPPPPNDCSFKSDDVTYYQGIRSDLSNINDAYWDQQARSNAFSPAKPWRFPMYSGYRLTDAGPGIIAGQHRQRRQLILYNQMIAATIRVSEGFNAPAQAAVHIPASTVQTGTNHTGMRAIAGMPAGSGSYISEWISSNPAYHQGSVYTKYDHYWPLLGLHGYGMTGLGQKSLLQHWNEDINPDIAGVSDETILAHAEFNTSRLIPAGVEATTELLKRGGVIPTHELAFQGGSGTGPCPERFDGRYGTYPAVPQLVKHPRLADVWLVKGYYHVRMVYDIMPSGEWPVWGPSDWNTPVYVPLLLGPTNEPPVANPDLVTTNFRTPLTFNPLANDTDPDEAPEPMSIVSISTPQSGTIAFEPSGSATYTPVEGYIGPVELTYEMTDGQATATSTITIDVTDGIDRPEANDDIAYTDWDTVATLQPLANDVTPMLGSLQITAVTQPEFGSVFINTDRQSLRFIPQKGRAVTVRMDYTISVEGRSDSATMRVVVTEPEGRRDDWEAKPFDYQKNCREHDDGKRSASYYEKCWNMFNNTYNQ